MSEGDDRGGGGSGAAFLAGSARGVRALTACARRRPPAARAPPLPGGSSTYSASLKQSALAEMTHTNVDVSAAASLSFYAKVGASVNSSSKASDYETFSSAVSGDTLSGIPEPAPTCGGSMCSDYSAWSTAVTANPQPVNIKLASIMELLTPGYFPHDGNITTKAAALDAFLTNDYCGTVPDCAPAPPPHTLLHAHLALSVGLDAGGSFYHNKPTNCDGVTVSSNAGDTVAGGLVGGRCLFNVTWAPQLTLVLTGAAPLLYSAHEVRSGCRGAGVPALTPFCLHDRIRTRAHMLYMHAYGPWTNPTGRQNDPSGEVQYHIMTSKFTMTPTSWSATTALSGANDGTCAQSTGEYGTTSDPITCTWIVSGAPYTWDFTATVLI